MTTIAQAEHIYLTEPDLPLCAQCGVEAPEPTGDNEPQCPACHRQEVVDNCSNHLEQPLRELLDLVREISEWIGTPDASEWRHGADRLRDQGASIAESLDAFAEELEA